LKQGRKVFNTDGDDRPPILDPNPSDVYVVEEDFDWSANDIKDKDINQDDDRCMVRQRSKTTSIRAVGLDGINMQEVKQIVKRGEEEEHSKFLMGLMS